MSKARLNIMREESPRGSDTFTGVSFSIVSWAIGIAISCLIVGFAYVGFPNYCASNDDHLISDMLSGFFTGAPDAHVTYVNYVWASFVKVFYELSPSLPWWGMFHILMLVLSICVFSASVLRLFYRTALRRSVSLMLVFLSAFALFFYVASTPNMATTASALGAAALSVAFAADPDRDSRRSLAGSLLLFSLLLTLCYFYRVDSCRIVAVLAGLLFLYRIVASDRKMRMVRYACIAGAMACILIGASTVLHSSAYSSQEWQDFRQFNAPRAQYLDFRLMAYEDNPAVFEEAGVSENFAYLINAWYMADDRVNADLYKYLKQNSPRDEISISKVLSSSLDTVRNTPLLAGGLLAFFSLSCLSLLLWRKKCLTGYDAVFCWGLLVSSIVFLLYVCSFGKPILRAILAFLVPIAALYSCVVFRGISQCRGRAMRIVAVSVAVTGLLFVSVQSFSTLLDPSNLDMMDKKSQKYSVAAQYASEHRYDAAKTNIFVIDPTVTQDNRIFGVNPDASTVDNCVSWGGWYVRSPLWYDKLKNLGIKEFSHRLFTQDNVYYVSSNEVYAQKLLAYLNETLHGGYVWDEMARLDAGVTVRRLAVGG